MNIAKDFSEFPFGRYESHGPFNGARFRNEKLLPLLLNGQSVLVDLSDARGLAASFLEEAFGGLVREGLSVEELRRLLKVVSNTDSSLVSEVWFYIEDAAKAVIH
ncbi:STAS-like domain-containing protein [Brevundimonas subvibrioides]|uniref:STAS-like domain-containing protein n=1 Tax=Brevundimonas subvibrioides TaxID=74313 RepID=UPI00145F8BB8|nr:STAS-like domain-containing protein [Brevundimonas subvibrioides]